MSSLLGRLLSPDGAGFALLTVPDLDALVHARDEVLVDVELLTPDRLVQYLSRTITTPFLEALATMYLAAAQEQHPELAVPTVQDEQGGVAVLVLESTDYDVTFEVMVIPDLEADVPEHDTIAFDVPRVTLVAAAHDLQRWLEDTTRGTGWAR